METNLTVNNTFRIYDNTAFDYAAGIYNEANLYVADDRDITNGVYIENRDSVVKILQELPNGSTIQIDNSNYVYPDVTKSPIVIAEATNDYPTLTENDRNAFIKPPTGFDNWTISLFQNDTQIVLILQEFIIEYLNLMGASNPNPTTYNIDTPTFTLLPPSEIVGYTFVGWVDEDGNPITEIVQGSNGNKRIYANWQSNQLVINHDGNGTPSTPVSNIPDPILFGYGNDVKLSATIPIRKGYIFLNWNTKKDGTGTTYYPNETISNLTTNLTLYAQWFSIPKPQIKYIFTDCNCTCCHCKMNAGELRPRKKSC